jgi:uroporphyrinogen decarboxylase
MDSRERVLTALRRKIPDRIPKMIYFPMPFGQYFVDLAKKYIGEKDPVEYLKLDVAGLIGYKPSLQKYDFSKYFAGQEVIGTVNEWGGVWQGDHISPFYPMLNFETAKEVEDYPFPEVTAEYRWEGLKEEIKEMKNRGYPAMQRYECGTFEQLWELRGLENIMCDFLTEPPFLVPLLEKVSDLKAQISAKYTSLGMDIIWTGDDLGSENSMMIDPDIWRKYLKPCSKKIIDAAKKVNPDVLIAFHSDGFMEPVIQDLIEIGVDILHPVQPECMNTAEIKKKYGNKLSFWGTIGCQQTLSYGTTDEVIKEVKERMSTVGVGGGLLIAPSHFIYPPTPWENILAFIETVDKYGK